MSFVHLHVHTQFSIADALTRVGLELEGIDNKAEALGAFRIAHVIEAVQHPNADRLRACKVDTGNGIVSVVCGAPNARTGMKARAIMQGESAAARASSTTPIRPVSHSGMCWW